MGVYVKVLKSPTHNVQIHTQDGSVMNAAISVFAYKESHSFYKTQSEKLAEARLEAAHRRWEGQVMPKIMIETAKDGIVRFDDRLYPCFLTAYADTPGPKPLGRVVEVRESKLGRRKIRQIVVEITHPELIPDCPRHHGNWND